MVEEEELNEVFGDVEDADVLCVDKRLGGRLPLRLLVAILTDLEAMVETLEDRSYWKKIRIQKKNDQPTKKNPKTVNK